jgi:arylsulfatase A-like enzyme
MRILYVDVDSLRPDHLGCYGYDRDTSPNIDALAASGRRFTDYYASDVPCYPSRTALFSGRFGIHTGLANHGGIAGDVRHQGPDRQSGNGGRFRTLPTALRDAGYHVASVSPFFQRHGAWMVLDGFNEWIDTGGNGSENADEIYAHAADWLGDHATEDDWFLHVNFWDPHTHYDTPMEYGTPFAEEPAPAWLDEETIAEHYASYGPHSARDPHGWNDEKPFELPRAPAEISSREEFKQWVDGYDVGVRYMDEYVGELLDDLEAAGVREETLVILSADHGENLGELNVYGDHQTADEYTCNVPLIVEGPGVEPGVDRGLHYNVDFAPTLTEFVGGDAAAGWDGRSFAESLTAGTDDGREYLVLSQGTWACQRAVRWADYLLVRTYHDGFKDFDAVELYDLAADPHETEDISGERPDLVERGTTLLQAWHSARMVEDAAGEAGGNPDAPRAFTDPLMEVISEGGPYYTRGSLADYAERLRETGRAEHAEKLERTEGIVEQDVSATLE